MWTVLAIIGGILAFYFLFRVFGAIIQSLIGVAILAGIIAAVVFFIRYA